MLSLAQTALGASTKPVRTLSSRAAAPSRRRAAVAPRAALEDGGGGGEPGRRVMGGRVGGFGRGPRLDDVDHKQQVDIDRLINACHELQDRVETMEAMLQSLEDRGRDRAVALRAILRDDKQMDKLLQQTEDGQLDLSADERGEPWDSYRNSFTLLISKGYFRAVESLRSRLMATEWELGLRPIALQLGVSRFEAWCADNMVGTDKLSFEALSELYEDPTDLRVIADPHLRMRARSIITQTEAEERVKAWVAATEEAQKLAHQFSEAQFISSIIPDPIEHGVVDALRKVVMPLMKGTGGA